METDNLDRYTHMQEIEKKKSRLMTLNSLSECVHFLSFFLRFDLGKKRDMPDFTLNFSLQEHMQQQI